MRFLQIYRTPLLVLALALSATLLAAYSVALTSKARDQVRFLTTIRWTKDVIQQRLRIYTSILESEAAFFAVSGIPTAAEFQAYVEHLRVQESFPGVQGVGFAQKTTPDEIPALKQHMREQGYPDFSITPPGTRPEYYPIIYLEPLDQRNREAIGYDMFADPVRHEAMARARDDGQPAASGKVGLVQETELVKQAGFLIYVPVYEGGKVPVTKAQRREKIRGFAYSPFRADDLFEGIFGGRQHPDVHINVYDGTAVVTANLLHASHVQSSPHPSLHMADTLAFAGHTWTLDFRTTPQFDQGSYRSLVPWVAGIGCLLSLLLAAITAALARAHEELQTAQAELQDHAQNLKRTVDTRTARLRETVSELEQMSYSMVHDMRAPLRAIQSFAGMLEEDAANRLSQQSRSYLDRMKTAAARMDALIRDVLNYGKLVRQELPLAPVDIPRLLHGMIETYPMFQPAKADIAVDGAIPQVLGNEAALTQCFSNLLSNAVKFVRPGQKPKVQITAERHNGVVRICVADQGIGIPKELVGKLFSLFERLSNSQEGTGMGLAIVRKAAERMGGKVFLESESGHGTRVYLDLKPAT